MEKKKIKILVLILVLIYGIGASTFIVYETQQALIFQFGKTVTKEPLLAGIHFKVPILQQVIFFERRLLKTLQPQSREVIAADKKRVIVDIYAKYRIIDPLLFYQTARNERGLVTKLEPILESTMREQIGKVTLLCLLGECRVETMSSIKRGVNEQAKIFGVQMVDVRITRTDLPKENSDAIFRRMQTAREKEAKEIRAEGEEASQKIAAEADKQKVILVSEAERDAEKLRGFGDAEAVKIYAKTFNQDPEFFIFLRSMQAYKEFLLKENTYALLSSESDFLKSLYNFKMNESNN